MSSRFVFPHAYDPHMHREEVLTLSRTTSQQNGINKVNGKSLSPSPMTAPAAKSSHPAPRRRHFVFADPVAFRGFVYGGDRATRQAQRLRIIYRRTMVLLSRVLGVPADEDLWSPRLRVYFKAISQYHARPKETPLGMLMVTNLSSFPSALTVIPVPDGDVRKHREDYIVNENLKRLGCSGRSGMSLSTPAGATQAKFFQLYKASDRIPLYGAVIELVKLCQVALMMFGKLEQEYADGLLCDVTEKAINDWWIEIGSEYYNVEPTDGILGPTTVSALLGMLMGARNRLNYYGAPVAKDAFDVYSLKRGIAYFQKSQKMEKTRRLDRHTLDRLHRVTAKAAAGEGWAIPKAVKSTVAELSGKGGEMLSSIAGRDKAEIGDIETLDIDRFVSLVHGERSKWLWYGKPRKSGGVGTSGKTDPEEPPEEEKESPAAVYTSPPPGSATSMIDSPLERDQLRKNVFKSVTGKMNDARSGFGRIKDAVGLRGHANRHSKDESMDTGYVTPNSSATLGQSTGTPASPAMVSKVFTWKETPGQYHNAIPKIKEVPSATASTLVQDSESPHSESRVNLPIVVLSPEDQKVAEAEEKWAEQVRDIRRDIVANDPSIAGSVYGDGDLEGPVLEALRDPNNFQTLLHRRHSLSGAFPVMERARNEAWWPRQMSFTDAEEAVLGWEPISVLTDDGDEADTWPALKKQQLIAEDYIHLYEKIAALQDDIGPWVVEKVDNIDGLDNQAAEDQERLQTLYYQLTEQYQAVKQSSEDVLTDERSHVMESLKDVEVLGAKLEYEINALVSKVQDVEDGVSQFERQVDDLESRAKDLETQLSNESWPHWLVRSITGIGTGPNIVAPRRNP
ncbi:hypothetical protein BDZ45DRAFT_115985 [Acephala macrosclerotiorum]|nr:hypothetical protein BDZ45DRAFT_115985 [Acephala macrosclerotiorum]